MLESRADTVLDGAVDQIGHRFLRLRLIRRLPKGEAQRPECLVADEPWRFESEFKDFSHGVTLLIMVRGHQRPICYQYRRKAGNGLGHWSALFVDLFGKLSCPAAGD